MSNWFIRLYNFVHAWRMRRQRAVIDKLRSTDIATLDTLDKLIPVLREQLDLISPRDLRMVNKGDIYTIQLPMYFLQYYFFKEWLKMSLVTISTHGNDDGKGYINLNNKVTGYTTQPLEVRISDWIPIEVIGINGIELDDLYLTIQNDLYSIEKILSNVTDPFFKNYYSQRLASALQDVLLVVYTINEMVAFYEWRR